VHGKTGKSNMQSSSNDVVADDVAVCCELASHVYIVINFKILTVTSDHRRGSKFKGFGERKFAMESSSGSDKFITEEAFKVQQ